MIQEVAWWEASITFVTVYEDKNVDFNEFYSTNVDNMYMPYWGCSQ